MPRFLAPLLVLLLVPACATGSNAAETTPAPVIVVPRVTPAPPPPPPAPPPAPVALPLEPAVSPACVLTANDIEPIRGIALRVDDSAPFFWVDKAKTLEVRLASPRSTVRASRSDLEIIGHTKLSDLPVRLRADTLIDGYLRVHHAALRDGDPAHLELEVEPPWFVTPVKPPVVPVTCDEIAIAREPGRTDTLLRGKQVDLREGVKIALRAQPGGPVVATLMLPKTDPGGPEPIIDVYEIARRGEQVHVRVEWDQTDVEGWVSRRDVMPHADLNMMGLLGALGGTSATIALASDAPLLVHSAGRVLRVGTARSGKLPCAKRQRADAGEIELDFNGPFGGFGFGGLGVGSGSPAPAEAKLVVAPTRGETCQDQQKSP